MKKLFYLFLSLVCAVALLPAQDVDAAAEPAPEVLAGPSYPAGTLAVARLKSFDTLGKAFDSLKTWVSEHPSVESLFDDEWQGIERLDLRATAAQYLDLTQEEFNNFFEGAMTLMIGDDLAWAQQSKMLPVGIELTASSADRAREFVQMLKDEDGVLETQEEAEGVERIRIDVSSQEEERLSDATTAQKNEMDLYVAQAGEKIILGNSLEYTTACLKALESQMGQQNRFWGRVEQADAALWVDPRAVLGMLRAQLEAKKQRGERGLEPKVLDDLGLNELEGVGLWASFVPLQVQVELTYSPSATGVARILTCTPTGLEASPLVPADAQEFSMGRVDVACLWTELRRAAKVIVPATDVIYQGWQKQLKESQGVNIDKQLFGSFGNKYVFFSRGTPDKPEGSALYFAVNDAVALQGGLEAFFGFFAQGKEFFEREKIAGVPVWRLKSEFQSANAPAVAYAIAPQWLIVSVGDPTQMQELIEDANAQQVGNSVFANDEIKQILATPAVSTFSHRPLRVALENFAAALIEVQERQQAAQEGENNLKKPPVEREIPSFDDVKESLIMWNESRPGSVMTTIKIISNDE